MGYIILSLSRLSGKNPCIDGKKIFSWIKNALKNMCQKILQPQSKGLYRPGKMRLDGLFGDGEMAGDLFLGITCLPAEFIHQLTFFGQAADKGGKFVPQLVKAYLFLGGCIAGRGLRSQVLSIGSHTFFLQSRIDDLIFYGSRQVQ
jgi:hypothetical protein